MTKNTKLVIGIIVAIIVLLLAGRAVFNSSVTSITERAMEAGTNGEADVQMNADGTMNVTTSEGSFTTGKELPSSWPKDIPPYAGAVVQFSGTGIVENGTEGMVAVFSTTDDLASVTQYFKTALPAQGWTIDNTVDAGSTTILVASKDNRTLSVSLATADGATSITLAVQSE